MKNYGKLTVDAMREALTVLTTVDPPRSEEHAIAQEAAAPVVKIKPMRAEERNGVKKPINGVCADVSWRCAAGWRPRDPKTLREIAEKSGWNQTNVSVEFGRWRKLHSLSRPTK